MGGPQAHGNFVDARDRKNPGNLSANARYPVGYASPFGWLLEIGSRRCKLHSLSLQELGQQLLWNQQPGLAKFLAPVTPPLAQSTAVSTGFPGSPNGVPLQSFSLNSKSVHNSGITSPKRLNCGWLRHFLHHGIVAKLVDQDHEAKDCNHRYKGSQEIRHNRGTYSPAG